MSTKNTALVRKFHKKMLGIYRRARFECDYRPTRFVDLVTKNGGYEAAKRLLSKDGISHGLKELCLSGRLDLSMKALVLRKPWNRLFSEQQPIVAKKRLNKLRYFDDVQSPT